MDTLNIRPVSGGAAQAVEKRRAESLVKSGRWELVPGAPIPPFGCPAELAQRAEAEKKAKAEDEAKAAKAVEESKAKAEPKPETIAKGGDHESVPSWLKKHSKDKPQVDEDEGG